MWGKLNLFFVQKKAKETLNKKIGNTRSSLANSIFPTILVWLFIFIYLYKQNKLKQYNLFFNVSHLNALRFKFQDLKCFFTG